MGQSAGRWVAVCLPHCKNQSFTRCLNVGRAREANLNSSNVKRERQNPCGIPNCRCLLMYSHIHDSVRVVFDFSWFNVAYQRFYFFFRPPLPTRKPRKHPRPAGDDPDAALSVFNTWDCKGDNTPAAPQPYNRRITAVSYLPRRLLNSAFLTVGKGGLRS